jgi:hypothetical protein
MYEVIIKYNIKKKDLNATKSYIKFEIKRMIEPKNKAFIAFRVCGCKDNSHRGKKEYTKLHFGEMPLGPI